MTKYQGLEKREIIRDLTEKLGTDRLIEVLEAVHAQQERHANEILESLSIPGKLPEDAVARLICLLGEAFDDWTEIYRGVDLTMREGLATYLRMAELSNPAIAQILRMSEVNVRQLFSRVRRRDWERENQKANKAKK